ncbi:hypothetical protein NL676_002865 [Syzygium grande]|nr:hypothetical protein NL676_002865 [Syzygium grande]
MFIQPLRFQHGGQITQQLVTPPNMEMDRLCGQFYSEAKEILALPMLAASTVMLGATLELTSKGDLVLKDANGTVAWFTNTSGKSVLGLNMTDFGNLVLFDKNNATVWQSYDEPTDSLVLGQKLRQGQRLMPSVSETNWTVDGGKKWPIFSQGLSRTVAIQQRVGDMEFAPMGNVVVRLRAISGK